MAVAMAVAAVALVDAASPAAASWEASLAPLGGSFPPPSWAVARAGARTMERVVVAVLAVTADVVMMAAAVTAIGQ